MISGSYKGTGDYRSPFIIFSLYLFIIFIQNICGVIATAPTRENLNQDTMLPKQTIEIIRKRILSISGLPHISPGDCKILSRDIKKTTGKTVSETTLKRFYGFARQEHNFSKYSLNTLCEYAGYKNWENFIAKQDRKSSPPKPLTEAWSLLRSAAAKANEPVISHIKKRCGIPFECTHPNHLINTDFEYFMQSNRQLYCLTGEAYTGKTIQVAHIVEELFTGEGAKFSESIPWVVSGNPIHPSASVKSVNGSAGALKALDIDPLLIQSVSKNPADTRGQLVIIIDGIDHPAGPVAGEDNRLSHIADLLLFIEKFSWIKIVLSIRSSTFAVFYQKFGHLDFVQRSLWSGLTNPNNKKSAVRVLSSATSKKVLQGLHQKLNVPPPVLVQELEELLRHPSFIQLYYQLLLKYGGRLAQGYTLYGELIQLFISQKIRQNGYGAESLSLLKQTAKMLNYGLDSLTGNIDIRELICLEDHLIPAYRKLLTEGVLQEHLQESHYDSFLSASFTHESIFHFFIARELVYRQDALSGTEIIDFIRKNYTDAQTRKKLLLWVFSHFLSHPGENLKALLFATGLPIKEKIFLSFFCVDFISHYPDLPGSGERDDFVEAIAVFICSHWMEIEWSVSYHEQTLRRLHRQTKDKRVEANVLLLLGMLYSLRLNRESLVKVQEQLKEPDKAIVSPNALSPEELLDYTFSYFLPDDSAGDNLQAVTDYIRQRLTHPPYSGHPDSMTSWLSVIVFQIFQIAEFQRSTPAVASAGNGRRQEPESGATDSMSVFSQIIDALYALRSGEKNAAVPIFTRLENDACHLSSIHGHSLVCLLFELISGIRRLMENDQEPALAHLMNAYEGAIASGFVFLYLLSSTLLIRVFEMLNEPDQIEKVLTEVQQQISGLEFPVERIFMKTEFFAW